MMYHSTRNPELRMNAAQAILQGLAPDEGLFVPESFPQLPSDFVKAMSGQSYAERAATVLELFIPEFGALLDITQAAYSRFDGHPAPLVPGVDDLPMMLELWHGPTLAFKDMALQVLPRLMSRAKEICGEKRQICVVTATSGDTGKAALEGFRDVDGVCVLVFYPEQGVSRMQMLQMITQCGENVGVCGIRGNFDSAQTSVKRTFADQKLREVLSQTVLLSSANSINLGRLLPQIAYYVSAYVDFAAQYGEEKMNICVPTGNFGNILAALYAKRMGVPIGKLLCASNQNDVLTQLINEGRYDVNRPFHTTISPSMDILISSNWERALFHYGGAELTMDCMTKLSENGHYDLPHSVHDALRQDMCAYSCDEGRTKEAIAAYYERTGRVIDPHTAVALAAVMDTPGFEKHTVVVSTAHPAKFPAAVLQALDKPSRGDLLEALGQHVPIPEALQDLERQKRRFKRTVRADEISIVTRVFAKEGTSSLL